MTTRYPVYVISKGRHETTLTADFLAADGVDFFMVVEPQEASAYAAKVGSERILVLPFSNLGLGGIPARNWVWKHAVSSGAKRHWILDDNIRGVVRLFKGIRIKCKSEAAFRAVEDFTDRYENIAISGLNYAMWAFTTRPDGLPPFYLNTRIYSCLLIDNSLPFRWRGRYNEDTDLCLQALTHGMCTVLFNAFMVEKMQTLKMKGGNTSELYKGDGRLRMARDLQRAWPYVVDTGRRFKRPQHVVRDSWRSFDTQLKRRTDIDWDALKPNEYGLKLVQVAPEVKSHELRELLRKTQSGA